MAFNKFGLLTMEQVENLEKEMGQKFPDDYRSFLLKTNGGMFDFEDEHGFEVEPIDEEDIYIDTLFGDREITGSNLIYWNKKYGEDAWENSIIIGNTISDGFILYLCSGEGSGIYFWDDNYAYECTSDEQNAYFICDTFDELLKLANIKID